MSLPRTPDLVAASAEQPYRFPWGRIFGELDQHSEETRWPDHFHPAHELLWAQGGAITVLVGRRLWTVAGSQALWIPAGTVYSGTVPAGVTSRVTFFDPEHTPARSEEPASVEITPLLGQLLEHLRTEDLGDGERHRAEAVVMDLVKPVPQPVILQMPTHELIAGAAEEILADPAASHGLDSWAERLGVSSRTLTRLFRSETGLGVPRLGDHRPGEVLHRVVGRGRQCGRGRPQRGLCDHLRLRCSLPEGHRDDSRRVPSRVNALIQHEVLLWSP